MEKNKEYWDLLALKLQHKFGESIIDEGDENNPYDWWLEDLTISDIIDFLKNELK